MFQLKCIIVICPFKQICCCVLLRINHPKEGEGRYLIVCLFYRIGWRAQEDGAEEKVHVTLISPTPRSNHKRIPKETPSNSREASDFFCEINLLVLCFMPSYPTCIFQQQLSACSNVQCACKCYHYHCCDQGICQLGVMLFAEESFLLDIDWSLTSGCNASID